MDPLSPFRRARRVCRWLCSPPSRRIYFIWGTTYLAIAIAIKTIPPFISGVARFLLAGSLMYVWLRLRSPRPFAGVNLPMAALCGVLLSGIGNGFVVWAQQGIPSGIAALIVTAVPVTVLMFDWAFFSKRAPTRQALVGTAVAVAGVVTIVMHTRSLSGYAQPLYLFAMIAAVGGWSFGTLCAEAGGSRRHRAELHLRADAVRRRVSVADVVVDGEWAHFDLDAVSTVVRARAARIWSCSAASSVSIVICGC